MGSVNKVILVGNLGRDVESSCQLLCSNWWCCE